MNMQLKPSLKIEGEILLNDREADVLHLLCSTKSIDWFVAHCTENNLSVDEIKTALGNVCSQTAVILEARRQALAAVNKVGKGALAGVIQE